MRRVTGSVLTAALVALGGLLAAEGEALGQQLVFTPNTPTFGGGPVTAQMLLQVAEAQRPQQARDPFTRDPLQDFEQSLQRQLLSQFSREIVGSQFGGETGFDFSTESRFDFGDMVVEVTPGLDGLDIRVMNVLTGAETVVNVPSF